MKNCEGNDRFSANLQRLISLPASNMQKIKHFEYWYLAKRLMSVLFYLLLESSSRVGLSYTPRPWRKTGRRSTRTGLSATEVKCWSNFQAKILQDYQSDQIWLNLAVLAQYWSFEQIFKGLFNILQNFNPTVSKLFYFWASFHCSRWPNTWK